MIPYEEDPLGELPLGFGMALTRYPRAMTAFGELSDAEKGEYAARAASVESRDEMDELVQTLMGLRQGDTLQR